MRNRPQFKLMLFNKNLIHIVPQRILFRIYKNLVRCYTSMLKYCNMAYLTAYIRVKLWQGHTTQLEKLLLSSSSSLITHLIRYRNCSIWFSLFSADSLFGIYCAILSFFSCTHSRPCSRATIPCGSEQVAYSWGHGWMGEALILLCVQCFSSGMWFDEYI